MSPRRKVPDTLPKGIMEKIAKHLKWADEPFDKKTVGKLKADVKYWTGKPGGKNKYLYTTDSKGRLKTAHAHPLKLDTQGRANHAKKPTGKKKGDHAGHLLGDRFGGSPKLDNIVSQMSSVNLSDFKVLENNWAKEVAKGSDVRVDVEVVYGAGDRPSKFLVREVIDGDEMIHEIHN